MKRILLATTALMAASAVHAADMAPSYTKAAPMPVAAPFSWTGFYVGANAGIGGDKVGYPFSFSHYEETAVTGNLGTQSFGGFAGLQAGYNLALGGGWVAGVEADIQWSNVRSNINANAGVNGNSLFALDAGTEVKWFGTARGRLGYGWDRVLLYATGGYAYGSETTHLNASAFGQPIADGLPFSRDASLSGYVVGGGLEYAFTPNVSMKTEYLYFDFGKRNVFTPGAETFPVTIDNSITMHTLKAGLNYRF